MMMRCKNCGAYVPDKFNYCPDCGDKELFKAGGQRKSAIRRIFLKILKKFIALLLYLLLTVIYMIMTFICVYGGMILSGLSVIAFIGAMLAILLMYMEPELGGTWGSVIPCFIASFIFMFLISIGEGLLSGIEYLRELVMDIIRD